MGSHRVGHDWSDLAAAAATQRYAEVYLTILFPAYHVLGCMCACVFVCVCVWVTQSHPTLCHPVDCSPPGSSVHGIHQARILSKFPFLSPGNLPNPGIKPKSPSMQVDILLLSHQGSSLPRFSWDNFKYFFLLTSSFFIYTSSTRFKYSWYDHKYNSYFQRSKWRQRKVCLIFKIYIAYDLRGNRKNSVILNAKFVLFLSNNTASRNIWLSQNS